MSQDTYGNQLSFELTWWKPSSRLELWVLEIALQIGTRDLHSHLEFAIFVLRNILFGHDAYVQIRGTLIRDIDDGPL